MKKNSKYALIYFVLLSLNNISNTFAVSSDSSSKNIVKWSDYYAAKDKNYKQAIVKLKGLEKETPKDADIQNY